MEDVMYKSSLNLLIVLAMAAAPLCGFAADKKVGTPSDIDNLIKRLEQSGALDAAIERGLQRQAARQAEAQRKQEEEQERLQAEAAKNARAVDINRDRVLGDMQADVSLIVYSDLECPYCKHFAKTPEQAIAGFAGKANVVFRHYPLPFHGEIAKRAAYYAECVGRQAGSKAFFGFVGDWFKLTKSNGQGLEGGDAQIREIAQAAGAKDVAMLDACARDAAIAQLVEDDLADGTRSGVNGTPGTIIRNNKTGVSLAISGAVPAEVLEQGIRKVLTN